MWTSVLRKVFRHPEYRRVLLGVSVLIILSALLLPNVRIINQAIWSESITLAEKIIFIFSLTGSLLTNFTFLSALYLLSTGILLGLNVSLLIFYIRRRQEITNSKKVTMASLGGAFSSILGIGCVTCGSVILTAVFGIVGSGSFLALLPLKGMEFGIIGGIFVLISINYLIKKISDPLVC